MSKPAQTQTAGVVIPVYNRPELLRRTLASLQAQDYPPKSLTVVVADDGSEEDIAGVVTDWAPQFEKRYVRQEREGFGAPRARNLGASTLATDVLIFLDSDSIVESDFITRHTAWHEANPDAVVIGGRVHVEAGGDLSVEALASGDADLRATATADRTDFRAVLSRRTSRYETTDEAYRALVSSNVSIPRSLFLGVGGFDERFRHWGSEDTELGWRLWQAGARFIDDPDTRIYHQLDADTAGGFEGRQQARELNSGLLASLVPHRFYRRGVPDPLPEVPKVSVMVHDVPPGAPEEIWKSLRSQTFPDFEVIYLAQGLDHDPFAGAAQGDPRCRFIPDPSEAVWSSRGEYLLFLNGHSAPAPSLLANVRKRLDQRPAAHSFTFGIEVPGEGTYGTPLDLGALDEMWGDDLPVALAVRRRQLIMEMRKGNSLTEALAALDRDVGLHTRQPLVALPGFTRTPRPAGFSYGRSAAKQLWEEAQIGPGHAFRAGLRVAKNRLRPSKPAAAPPPRAPTTSPPGVRYVGWVGKENLGDEAMLEATRKLMPWGEVVARGEARDLLLLGGGTLINRNQYLSWLTERDSPRIERAVLGTGVASPAFWGLTEDTEQWIRWLGTCAYVGVRGPASAETLKDWGFKGDFEVCGDPALALRAPDAKVDPDRILIAPAWTSGELWGESDDPVYRVLVEAAAKWIGQGREVTFMSSHPSDDRPIIEMRDRLDEAPSSYLPGYLDVYESLRVIAGSALVVGERLHACVLAAAAGRPFVGIEYRPKVRDFARSVGMDDHVIRADQLDTDRLLEQAETLQGGAPAAMTEAVARYRGRLERAAATIRAAVEA